jgi:natural product precursor
VKTLKKIHLKSVSNFLSEREMKSVIGGEGYGGSGTYDDPYQLPEVVIYGNYDSNTPKPCSNNGCRGPHGTRVAGGVCCLLPCFGILKTYGYGIVIGISSCPW